MLSTIVLADYLPYYSSEFQVYLFDIEHNDTNHFEIMKKMSISMSGATAIAIATAQIVLMDGSLKQLITLFDLAKQHKHTVDRSFLMTLVPTSVAVGGIVFLHFGIAASIMLYYSGLAAGMGNAALPLFKKRKI